MCKGPEGYTGRGAYAEGSLECVTLCYFRLIGDYCQLGDRQCQPRLSVYSLVGKMLDGEPSGETTPPEKKA